MSVVIMLCQKDLTQQCIFSLLSNMAQGQLHLLLFINCDKNECLCACSRLNSTTMLSNIAVWPPRGLHNIDEKRKLYISAFHFLFGSCCVCRHSRQREQQELIFFTPGFQDHRRLRTFSLHVWEPTAQSARHKLTVLYTMFSAQQQKETQQWPHQLCLNSAFTFRSDLKKNLQEDVGNALSVHIKVLILKLHKHNDITLFVSGDYTIMDLFMSIYSILNDV